MCFLAHLSAVKRLAIYPANKCSIVGIFTFMSRTNCMLSRVEHEKSFITSGPEWPSSFSEISSAEMSDECAPSSRKQVRVTNTPLHPTFIW